MNRRTARGSRSTSSQRRRFHRVNIRIENGHFQIAGLNAWYSHWREPYHLLLTIPWLGFVAIVVFSYLAVNAIFALLYLAGGDCIANATPGSFWDHFFFSVQTLASIGYGAMYPKTFYAHAIVTIEAIFSLVGIALLTGLAFARFSRPTARVAFSQYAVILPHEGVPTLCFRTANQRRNQILEAQLKVYLLRDEITTEGEYLRRIHDLRLIRHQTPGFSLTWLVLHPIDELSPLYGMTPGALAETNCVITTLLSGIDETVTQVVHARHNYVPQDILWNHRFVDLVYKTPDGNRYIDYTHFHEVIPLQTNHDF
jgi:inward rectifier potassium channel